MFGGHDASVNLAKMSHDPAYLNKIDSVGLKVDEKQALNDWIRRFQ